MAQVNEHGRLITAAAKAALTPLGCCRKGRSRLWFSDQRFWVISIEFQPSGWSKGSYLNVGATWLWRKQTHISFDAGYRVAAFIPFENIEQFKPLINDMAETAASEVRELRKRFRSLSDVHRWLVANATRDGWPIYHAAVAAGLVGDVTGARQLFNRIGHWKTDSYDWQLQLKADSTELARLLPAPELFRRAVLQLIQHRRSAIGLPPDPNCLDENDPTIVQIRF
ncbi:MAG: hypothetical protein ACO1NY_13275 [Pseudorhodoplanes sp.]